MLAVCQSWADDKIRELNGHDKPGIIYGMHCPSSLQTAVRIKEGAVRDLAKLRDGMIPLDL